MTQYDLDLKSQHAKNFKTIRKILLSYSEITELKNAKQTSYRDSYGVVVMMRTKGDVLVLAFGKGYKLQEKFHGQIISLLCQVEKAMKKKSFICVKRLEITTLKES